MTSCSGRREEVEPPGSSSASYHPLRATDSCFLKWLQALAWHRSACAHRSTGSRTKLHDVPQTKLIHWKKMNRGVHLIWPCNIWNSMNNIPKGPSWWGQYSWNSHILLLESSSRKCLGWACRGSTCLFLNKHRWDCCGEGDFDEAVSETNSLFVAPSDVTSSNNNKFSFYFLSITYLSFGLKEFNSLLLGGFQPAPQKLCLIYTQAQPTWDLILNQTEMNCPGKTATESWARSFQASVFLRDTPLAAVCLNTSPCRRYPNCLQRFLSLLASKSQSSHGIMHCCSFVACLDMLTTHWHCAW